MGWDGTLNIVPTQLDGPTGLCWIMRLWKACWLLLFTYNSPEFCLLALHAILPKPRNPSFSLFVTDFFLFSFVASITTCRMKGMERAWDCSCLFYLILRSKFSLVTCNFHIGIVGYDFSKKFLPFLNQQHWQRRKHLSIETSCPSPVQTSKGSTSVWPPGPQVPLT